MIRIVLASVAATLLVAACSKRAEAPTASADAPVTETARFEGRDAIGRIYHYVRSNQDGSEAEDVYVFRKSRVALEVYKAREKCTNAAYVTADLDLEKGYATRLGGGRLLPNAGREEFGVLEYDAANRILDAVIKLPDRDPLTTKVLVEDEPWHLYDFDLASLTVMTPHIEPRSDFSFGLALTINDLSREDFLVYLGRADLTYRQDEEHGGRPAHRYIVGGPAFGSFGGSLWLDAEEGHILDVETAIPNHIEYETFKLALSDIDDGGEAAWEKLLTAHFEGCETPAE